MAREMINSGIEWIGEIPADWDIISFWQAIERMGTGLNPRDNFELTKDDEYFYVTIRNFKNGKLFLDENCDRISPTAFNIIQQRSQLKKGDILFASISENGNAYVVEEEPENWNINESVFTIRVNNRFFEKYFYYHLINVGYYTDLRMDATGSTFQSIKQNKLRTSKVIMPPLEEQKKIADFLDRICAEIDTVIEDTKATIEEYKKLKQSVITEAVTKGIRGNRPMKDSGVEWIGDIPAEWNVKKLKYTSEFKQNKYNEVDGDLTYIGLENIVAWNGQYIETASEYDKEQSLICEANDILFGKLRPYLAKVYISPKKQCCSGEFCVIAIKEQNTKFMWYQLISHGFIFMVDRSTYGTKMPRANADYVKNMSVSIPSLEEQEEIADFLDRKCADFDKLIADKTHLLEEMESYKKSVIYEYVTGKKEVVL